MRKILRDNWGALLIGSALAVAITASDSRADVATGHPTFNWTNSSTWTDGTPLTAAQITAYQLVCAGPTPVNEKITAAAGIPPRTFPAATAPGLSSGDYSCTVAIHARRTPTSAEVLGIASNPGTFTVPAPRPIAPTALSID